MNFLDFKTVLFISVLINIICTFIIILLWYYNKKRFAGISYWAIDWLIQSIAMILLMMRGSVPDWLSIILANSIVIIGAIICYIGLERFTGKKSTQIYNYILLLVFILVHIYFTYFNPSLAFRNINVSAGLLIICFQCIWLMLVRVDTAMRSTTRIVGIVFGGYCIVNILRLIMFFLAPQSQNDYFKSGIIDTILFLSYHILLILLTFSLGLMMNRRLFTDIQTQEEKFSKVFHSSPYGIILARMPDGKVYDVNVGFENITGYSAKDLLGRSILETNFWIDKQDHTDAIKELLKKGSIQNIELKFQKNSGEIMTGLLSADIIIINNEKIVLSSITDISERKRTEEHITHLAQHDALTDLPNRVLFEDRLKQAIALAGRNKELVALMYIDLDFFKQINDNFGHTVGDSILMGAARRMLDSVRKSDTVARIGGDEFVVLLQEIKEGNEALVIAEQIRLALNRPFELAGHFISTSPSIGLVLYPEHGADELQLIRNADIAMYKAKENGRNNVKMFKESYKN